ncbi:MAG: DUF6702 family protein, partial [Chloroflexota bacterium]
MPSAHAHANSVSYAEFSVDGRVLHGVLRVPIDDVDLLLRLDRDLDGQVSVAELDAAREVLRGYLAKHVRVTVNGGTVTPTFDRFSVWRDASAFQYVESAVSYEATRAIEQLAIHTDLLTELYPAHQTLGRIRVSGRDERFTFQSSATYDRRIGSDRAVAIAAVLGAVALLTALWLARRRASASARSALGRGTAGAAVVILLAASPAQADV